MKYTYKVGSLEYRVQSVYHVSYAQCIVYYTVVLRDNISLINGAELISI